MTAPGKEIHEKRYRTFLGLVVLAFLLIPGVKASGQTQYAQSPPDEISVRQARRPSSPLANMPVRSIPAKFCLPLFLSQSQQLSANARQSRFRCHKQKERRQSIFEIKSQEHREAFCDLQRRLLLVGYSVGKLLHNSGQRGSRVPPLLRLGSIRSRYSALFDLRRMPLTAPNPLLGLPQPSNSLHAYAISHPNDSGDFPSTSRGVACPDRETSPAGGGSCTASVG